MTFQHYIYSLYYIILYLYSFYLSYSWLQLEILTTCCFTQIRRLFFSTLFRVWCILVNSVRHFSYYPDVDKQIGWSACLPYPRTKSLRCYVLSLGQCVPWNIVQCLYAVLCRDYGCDSVRAVGEYFRRRTNSILRPVNKLPNWGLILKY